MTYMDNTHVHCITICHTEKYNIPKMFINPRATHPLGDIHVHCRLRVGAVYDILHVIMSCILTIHQV